MLLSLYQYEFLFSIFVLLSVFQRPAWYSPQWRDAILDSNDRKASALSLSQTWIPHSSSNVCVVDLLMYSRENLDWTSEACSSMRWRTHQHFLADQYTCIQRENLFFDTLWYCHNLDEHFETHLKWNRLLCSNYSLYLTTISPYTFQCILNQRAMHWRS